MWNIIRSRVDQNFLSYNFHIRKISYQKIPYLQKTERSLYDKLFSKSENCMASVFFHKQKLLIFFLKMISENGLGGVRNLKQVKKTLVYAKQQRLDGLAFIMHESNRNCLEAVFHK